jgi:hypothetical protein
MLAAAALIHGAFSIRSRDPEYYLLENDFEPWLLNAHHLKAVPGRKTDVNDAEWIGQLVEHGLVRASFVPPREIRELRDLTSPVLFRPYRVSRAAALPVAPGLRDRR